MILPVVVYELYGGQDRPGALRLGARLRQCLDTLYAEQASRSGMSAIQPLSSSLQNRLMW